MSRSVPTQIGASEPTGPTLPFPCVRLKTSEILPTPAPRGSNRLPSQAEHGPSVAPHRLQVSPGSGRDPHEGHRRSVLHWTQRTAGAYPCLLYTSDAADDLLCVDLG